MLSDAISQYKRVKRFQEKVLSNRGRELFDYEDDVISFFLHCWHLKDFVQNDPDCSTGLKREVEKYCEQSEILQICRDLCHRAKHLKINDVRRNAEYSNRTLAGFPSCVHINEDGSTENVGDSYAEFQLFVDADLKTANGLGYPTRINVVDLSSGLIEEWDNFFKINELDFEPK